MSQDKIQKARELVLNYIASHSLSDKLNKGVNELCRSRPSDPWLFLSDIISEWTKDAPIIDRLSAKQGIDINGNASLQLNLYGRVANSRPPRFLGSENLFISSSCINTQNSSNDDTKQDNDKYDTKDCLNTMQRISKVVSPALRSYRIHEQLKIDSELKKLYDDHLRNDKNTKFELIPTISTLIANTSCNYLKIAFYKYLKQLSSLNSNNRNDNDDENYAIPNIMCEIVNSNRLPCISIVSKEHLLINKQIEMITQITAELIKIVKNKNENNEMIVFNKQTGAIELNNSNMDTSLKTLDDLLSVLGEAITNAKYEMNKDVTLCLSFAKSHQFVSFDVNSKEYTLNQEKKLSQNELVDWLSDLLNKYKGIEFLEDPLSQLDHETYASLQSKLGDMNVNVIGNKLYSSKVGLIENGIDLKKTKMVCIDCDDMFTVSNALEISKLVDHGDSEVSLMVSDNNSNNNGSTFAVDLAVACNAKMLRLALPNCGKSMNKYNRLLSIADELSQLGTLEEVVVQSSNLSKNTSDDYSKNGDYNESNNNNDNKSQNGSNANANNNEDQTNGNDADLP